jgi:hypothetical protein
MGLVKWSELRTEKRTWARKRARRAAFGSLPCYLSRMRRRTTFAIGFLLTSGCADQLPVRFPPRAAPLGYPATRVEDLPKPEVGISRAEVTSLLVSRSYTVRFGVVPLDRDRPVDAMSLSAPIIVSGPFEKEIRVKDEDIYFALYPYCEGKACRLLACIDIRPQQFVRLEPTLGTRVLEVRHATASQAMPIVIDAVTRQPAPDALDPETNHVFCDLRIGVRRLWENNVMELHRRQIELKLGAQQ